MKKIKRFILPLSIGFFVMSNSTIAQTNTKVLDLPFNGNATDMSSNANVASVNGATLTSDRFGNENSAYYFDGNSNITFPNISAYNGMESFTLSAWVKPEDLSNASSNNIISKVTPGRDFVLYINHTSKTAGTQFASLEGGIQYTTTSGTSPIALNDWSLITSTWDGSVWKIYVNGVLENTSAPSTRTPDWTGGDFSIGSLSANKSYGFTGAIDEVCILRKALSPEEIASMYLPATKKILDLPFTGSATDISENSNSTSINGATLTTDRFGNTDEAYHFNGNANITLPNISEYNNLEAFTLNAWVKPDILSNPSSNNIISKVTPGRDFVLYINHTSSTAATHFASLEGGIQYTSLSGNSVIPTDNWSMITSSWDGSVWKIYVNGVLQATSAPSTREPDWTGTEVSIGSLSANKSFGFTGNIDEVSIFGAALSDSEIERMYNPGIGTVTGIFTSNLNNTFFVYPNPVNSIVNVSEDFNKGSIFSSSGILQMEFNNQSEINVEKLESGYYILNLETDNGILTSSFIKK